MSSTLDIRFDLTTEEKAKEFFEKARKYLTKGKLDEEEPLMVLFGNSTNEVYHCFTNFIERPYFEDWLDIAELVLEDTKSVLSDMYLRFIGDIGKENFLAIYFNYDSDTLNNNVQDIVVKEDIKTYKEFAHLVKQEIKILEYLKKREISQSEVLNIEQIRKDILFNAEN